MPVLNTVLQSDTFDIWRQRTNDAINALNNQGVNAVIKIVNPLNDQDILVYNIVDGFFENTGIAALVTAIITELNSLPVNNVKPYYLARATQLLF